MDPLFSVSSTITATWWNWLALITIALLGGAMRFVDANVDAMRREWLMYARGLDGERLVALVLDELGSDWHVFHGLKLWQDQDCDHVLVGPRGIFYIQTKNWRGLMTRQGDNVLHNGQRVDAMNTIRTQAMELKDRLSRESGMPVRRVNSILRIS